MKPRPRLEVVVSSPERCGIATTKSPRIDIHRSKKQGENESMMKHPNRIPVLLLTAGFFTAALFTPSLFAADEEKEAPTESAAKRLMKVMQVEKQMAPMWENMKGMQDAMLDQQNLTNDEKEQAREIMAASMEEVEKALSWENLEPMMVRVYAATFTAEEMDKMSDFFESPDGQTYVEKQPNLQQAMMTEMQTLMTDLMPKIQQRTQEAIERIQSGEAN